MLVDICYIKVKRADDTSNFDVIEDEPSSIDISSLTDKKTLKHLPFIGFTFTSDKVSTAQGFIFKLLIPPPLL